MSAVIEVGVGWAESVWQRQIVAVQRLAGGWTSTMVDVDWGRR